MVEALYTYSPTDKVTKVIWKPPDTGWAQAKEIEELSCTNTQAEAMAILRALKYIETAHLDRKVVTTLEEIWKQMQGKTDHNSHSQGSK
ncbi:hypothetical protein KY290_031926 [Solanum tuberosum]|uniref:RNase H type-1 domain-containing protein n=1 Tax=Solanum tuberosum TaxID=4113 RepID=A0ABQ7UBQ5_SOLTU|nr:hypothetical protein KY290_031926 [Solanum tuberosum]